MKLSLNVMMLSFAFLVSTSAQAHFKKESECKLAERAAYEGFTSIEQARRALPMLFAVGIVQAKLKPEDAVPAEVLKDPANKLADHYEDWARIIFINPWRLEDRTGKKDEKAFLVIMKEGNLLKGNLPVALPRQDGTYKNYIRFEDPTSKAVSHLSTTHEYQIGKAGDGFTTSESETMFSGKIATIADKYVPIEVEAAKEADYLEVIHHELASDVVSLQHHLVEDKKTSKEAVRFALKVCRAIENPTEMLKRCLDDLEAVVK